MNNTREYRTIIRCTSKLVNALKHDLGSLSVELLSAELISEGNASSLTDRYHNEVDRATRLVEFVRTQVELNPRNYGKFIEVLKEREVEHASILNTLETKYKELDGEANGVFGVTVTHSPPANMCQAPNQDYVVKPRSCSTPSGYIPWFQDRGLEKLDDHIVLHKHGVNNKCLRLLSEENVATISGELSTGGGAIFKKLCSDALSIDGCPSNGDAACSSSGNQRCKQTTSSTVDSKLDQRLEMSDHFAVCQYLRDVPDEAIRTLGTALGLNYPKVQKMKSLPEDMVAAWIRREDNVLDNGDPTLRKLAKALKEPGIGQGGVGHKILNVE